MRAWPSTFLSLGAAEHSPRIFHLLNGRVPRFVLTGGLAGLTQLALLKLFINQGIHALPANLIAFLLAAQLNFVLSNAFTWADRRPGHAMWRRWSAFHGSIASMAIVNMIVFAFAHTVMPVSAASVAGIGVAAIGNFFIGDHLVFRSHPGTDPSGRLPQENAAA
jgi:putative flippase GtrA